MIVFIHTVINIVVSAQVSQTKKNKRCYFNVNGFLSTHTNAKIKYKASDMQLYNDYYVI